MRALWSILTSILILCCRFGAPFELTWSVLISRVLYLNKTFEHGMDQMFYLKSRLNFLLISISEAERASGFLPNSIRWSAGVVRQWISGRTNNSCQCLRIPRGSKLISVSATNSAPAGLWTTTSLMTRRWKGRFPGNLFWRPSYGRMPKCFKPHFRLFILWGHCKSILISS